MSRAGENSVERGLVEDAAAERGHARGVGLQGHVVEPRDPALTEPPLDADLTSASCASAGSGPATSVFMVPSSCWVLARLAWPERWSPVCAL